MQRYERLGLRSLGVCLSCCRDTAFAEGFDQRIRLACTQTIVEGELHCDSASASTDRCQLPAGPFRP